MNGIFNPLLRLVAQTNYGEQIYGGEDITYSGLCLNDACTVTASPLANTGFTLWFAFTCACLLILIALIVRFWKKPNKKKKDSN